MAASPFLEICLVINSKNRFICGVTFFTTELKGKKVLRMCTINPETTRKDICDTVERLKDSAAIKNSSVVLRAVG